jgi:hypothetical protein
MHLVETSHDREWKEFVHVNGNEIFQIALLLCGGAQPAETTVIARLDDLDVSRPPGKDDLAVWQRAVVMRSVRTADWLLEADLSTLSMLQPGLWPVMQIAGRSRICFVLQMLLGYAAASCAQMLDIEERAAPALLGEAVIQLHNNLSQLAYPSPGPCRC